MLSQSDPKLNVAPKRPQIVEYCPKALTPHPNPTGVGAAEVPRKKLKRSKLGKRVLSGFASASSDSDKG